MCAMTEIEWLDGRVTKEPELALGDAFGESVQAELDFGFDDVLEGLWVVVRHHEPDEDSDDDPRGRGCALHADCRYSLVEPSDLDRVFCILYEGQPRVCRAAGELGPHVSGPHSGHRPHPAFGIRRPALRSRPADGFPVYGKTIALIYVHSRFGNMFRHTPPRGYTRSALHRYTATRLRGYTPPPAERREGRPWAPSGHAPFFEEVPSGPPESRLHLQAFFRNRTARLKNPGLRRGTPSAFPRTHCAIVKRRARASGLISDLSRTL